jgi:hypothetical protein
MKYVGQAGDMGLCQFGHVPAHGTYWVKKCVGESMKAHIVYGMSRRVRAHGSSWYVLTGARPAHDVCRVKTMLNKRMRASVRACECLDRRQHVRRTLECMTVDGSSKFLYLVDW